MQCVSIVHAQLPSLISSINCSAKPKKQVNVSIYDPQRFL